MQKPVIFASLFSLTVILVMSVTIQTNARQANPGTVKLPQLSGGLNGYISFHVPRPPDEYRAGVSFYVGIWPLLEKPLEGFQIGLPSTWIIPDNTDFEKPLCPPGTIARDNWPERGPVYRDVFQTIEGGLGYWGSTQFGSATPKYRMNGTPDGYNHEISSPGWGFGQTNPLPDDYMGIAQLSNRLLVPPDGLTFKALTNGELLGNAWMSLPISESYRYPVGAASTTPTGSQCWTLFLNASNFKGPVAYWTSETWSKLSRGYPTINGRGLDSRPALMNGGAMEFNTVPYFEKADSKGVVYSRVPKLLFPTDASGRSVLMQDVTMYSAGAVADSVHTWLNGDPEATGRFDKSASWHPQAKAEPISFHQGQKSVKLTEYESTVKTIVEGTAFCLQWTGSGGIFPEYYKQAGNQRVVVSAADVPAETHLAEQMFKPAENNGHYDSPYTEHGSWSVPGPVHHGPYRAVLTDGSTVTYAWYRFVDQPALQNLRLTSDQKAKLQRFVERLHARWKITNQYIPPPTRGTLAVLDSALLVKPPKGLELGYVPIVVDQRVEGRG